MYSQMPGKQFVLVVFLLTFLMALTQTADSSNAIHKRPTCEGMRDLSHFNQPEFGTTALLQLHNFEVYNDPDLSGMWCYRDDPGSGNIHADCNDQTSSVHLASGWSARLYRDQNQGGSSICFNRGDANLNDNTFQDNSSMDNAISSFTLYNVAWCNSSPSPAYPLEVYSNANYGGTWCYAAEAKSANIHSDCNDQITSILLRSGWSVRVYRDQNQSGPSGCLNGSDANLSNNSFGDGSSMDNDISSFTLYSEADCGTPTLTRSRLYVDGRNYLVLEFCGTNIHQDVYIGSKRAGRDFGIHAQRVDFGTSEQCATDDNLADGVVLPGRTYYSGVALAHSDVYNVCSSSQGLCDSVTTSGTPPPSSGFLTFPIGRSPSQVPVTAWFDTYYDQKDRNASIISEYNGIEGYNRISTGYTGPGYCSGSNGVYFYPGYITDYKHSTPWYYRCNWSPGRAYNRHGGTDYGVTGANVPIKAAAPGTVVYASSAVVIIHHSNNTRTFYGHIRNVGRFNSQCQWVGNLRNGDRVGRGQIIGCGIDGANHLHFGVKLNAGGVLWHDGNPANHAPIVDPYTHDLWVGSPPHLRTTSLEQINAPLDDLPEEDNLTPIGQFSMDATYAQVGQAVGFDATGSYDEDGNVTSFEWDFGDGITTTGQTTSHIYTTPGTYYVELAVQDDMDGVGYAEKKPIVLFDTLPSLTEVERAFHSWTNLTDTVQITIDLAQTPQAHFEASWASGDIDLMLVDPAERVITSGTTISGVVVDPGPNRLTYVLDNAPAGDYAIQLAPESSTPTGIQLRTSVVDVTPPTEAEIKVQANEVISQAHFTLAVTDTESTTGLEMRYALNDDAFDSWQLFTSTVQVSWSIDQGPDGIVFQFRDSNGNLSPFFDETTFYVWLQHDHPIVSVYLPLTMCNNY